MTLPELRKTLRGCRVFVGFVVGYNIVFVRCGARDLASELSARFGNEEDLPIRVRIDRDGDDYAVAYVHDTGGC